MKKHVFGKKFKRDTNERKALFKNLLTSLVLEERVKTTTAKAKAIKAAADKLITKAKKGGRDAYRALEAEVNHDAVIKLVSDLAGRFAKRQGGYTRIIKSGRRVADNAHMAIIEWVEKKETKEIGPTKEPKAKEQTKKVQAEKAPKQPKSPKNPVKTKAKEKKK